MKDRNSDSPVTWVDFLFVFLDAAIILCFGAAAIFAIGALA